ncbi:MAG: 4Fe-4S dicluster domain-containing protein [Bacteroidales bacterium]
MKDWGYKIHTDRSIVWEEGDFSLIKKIRVAEPTVDICISCGSCASGCTSAQFTDFSLRRIIVNLQRGRVGEVRDEVDKCMLCGKCILACPRGVNTRNIILSIRKELKKNVLPGI